MKFNERYNRIVLSVFQVILLLGTVIPTHAVTDVSSNTVGARLEQSERIVFAQTQPNLSIESRLRRLEMNLFGRVQKGPINPRLESIDKALGNNKTNILLPPLAPQLDVPTNTFSTGSMPKTAPSVDYTYLDYSANRKPADVYDTITSAANQEKSMLNEAMRLYSARNLDGAEATFKRVLLLNNKNVDAYFNLGVIAENKGDLSLALSNYKKAANLNPNDAELKEAVVAIQNKMHDQVARDHIQKQEQQEDLAQAQLKDMVSQASDAYKTGNFDRAIDLLQAVAARAPQDADVQYALGQAYCGKDNWKQARKAFNRAINISPANQLYHIALNEVDQQLAQSKTYSEDTNSLPNNTYPPNNNDRVAYDQNNSPAGEIMPFTNSSSNGWSQGRSFRGGILFNGGSSPNTRLQRAMVGGLAGAAMGALLMSGGGRVGTGAIRGGILGTALGLMLGH